MPQTELKPIHWFKQTMEADFKKRAININDLTCRIFTVGEFQPGTFGIKMSINKTSKVLLVNNLPYNNCLCDTDYPMMPASNQNPCWLNLHLHGFWGPALQDDVYACVKPGQQKQYNYSIDQVHPTGLYAIHPHNFSSSVTLEHITPFPVQIYNPHEPDYPENIPQETLFIMQAYMQKCDPNDPDGCQLESFDFPKYANGDFEIYEEKLRESTKLVLTNGAIGPIKQFPVGVPIILRFVWIGILETLRFVILDDLNQKIPFRVLSIDSLPITEHILIRHELLLAHMQRFDIMVTFEKSRQYRAMKIATAEEANEAFSSGKRTLLFIDAVNERKITDSHHLGQSGAVVPDQLLLQSKNACHCNDKKGCQCPVEKNCHCPAKKDPKKTCKCDGKKGCRCPAEKNCHCSAAKDPKKRCQCNDKKGCQCSAEKNCHCAARKDPKKKCKCNGIKGCQCGKNCRCSDFEKGCQCQSQSNSKSGNMNMPSTSGHTKMPPSSHTNMPSTSGNMNMPSTSGNMNMLTVYDTSKLKGLKLKNPYWVQYVNKNFRNIENIAAWRTMRFSYPSFPDIEGAMFDVKTDQVIMSANHSEVWLIGANSDSGTHSLHIHLMWFLIMAERRSENVPWNFIPIKDQRFQDTLTVLPNQQYLVWMFPFANMKLPKELRATGRAMIHCHMSDHTDSMMMLSLLVSGSPNTIPSGVGLVKGPQSPEILEITKKSVFNLL